MTAAITTSASTSETISSISVKPALRESHLSAHQHCGNPDSIGRADGVQERACPNVSTSTVTSYFPVGDVNVTARRPIVPSVPTIAPSVLSNRMSPGSVPIDTPR